MDSIWGSEMRKLNKGKTMDNMNRECVIYQQKVQEMNKTMEKLEKKLDETNESVMELATTLAESKALEERMKHIDFRLNSLEKSRWHIYGLIIAGFVAAIFKMIIKG